MFVAGNRPLLMRRISSPIGPAFKGARTSSAGASLPLYFVALLGGLVASACLFKRLSVRLVALAERFGLPPRKEGIHSNHDNSQPLYPESEAFVRREIKGWRLLASILVAWPAATSALYDLRFCPGGPLGALFATAGLVCALCTLWVGLREHPSTRGDRPRSTASGPAPPP